MNPIGVNILAQYVRNTSALMDFLRRSDPAAVVVMDSPPMAAAIHAQQTKATVIHRAYNPNDAQWENVTDPQSWLNANAQHGGVVTQCMNEPAPGDLDKFLSWLEGVVRLAPNDVTLALPNFAVGNPFEGDIQAGKYDRILRLVCGTRHYLALHEYFKDDPAAEDPYLCGRFTYWQKRAQVLNLPPPRLVITEHGRDVGGGRNDGWQGAGWSEAEYFARLASAQKSVYEYAVPVTIYCWGTGANNDWLSFDIEDANSLQASIVQFGQEHPLQSVTPVPPILPPHLTPLGLYTLTQIPASYVNVRAAPSPTAADVGDLHMGDVVQRFTPDVNGWTYVEKDALKGWVSLQGGNVVFEKVTTPDVIWTVNLRVPFVSQIDSTSAASNNDCGIASLLMQIRYWIDWETGITPSLPTVDEAEKYTPLANHPPPLGLTFAEIDALARRYGFSIKYISPLMLDKITQYLDANAPVMVLVDYGVFNPGAKSIPHLCIVKGYNATHVLCADPYMRGNNYAIPRSQLEAAMRTVPGNVGAYQGAVLAV